MEDDITIGEMTLTKRMKLFLVENAGYWWMDLAYHWGMGDRILDIRLFAKSSENALISSTEYLLDMWMKARLRSKESCTVGHIVEGLNAVQQNELAESFLSHIKRNFKHYNNGEESD